MKTVTIGIGNSDDKLPQSQWANYVFDVEVLVKKHCFEIHFSGGSEYYQKWQNACWVFEIDEGKIPSLKGKLSVIRAIYHQNSVAWIEGVTEAI